MCRTLAVSLLLLLAVGPASATVVTLPDTSQSTTFTATVSELASVPSFTPPTGGSVTWPPGDITWNAATWSNGTGSAGTMSIMWAKVVDTNANAASTSTSDLVFTLAAKSTVDRAGDHTLSAAWKVSTF